MIETWFDPVVFSLGPIAIRWFGVLIALGIFFGAVIFMKLMQKQGRELSHQQYDSLLIHLLVGLLVGGRLFYTLIYNSDFYLTHLLQIFAIWRGGLSFHGAFIGAGYALWRFSRKHQLPLFVLSDALSISAIPLIFLGKIGNYINGEAYGRITDSFMGIIIPATGTIPRHPSQLYEAFLLGPVLAAILWTVNKRKRFAGVTTGFFIMSYGILRIFAEFFREADPQIGYFMRYFTLGQVLCVGMIMMGVWCLDYSKKQNQSATS